MDTRHSRYTQVRTLSEDICAPLEIEDYVVQPCAEVSPPKWHLAHTTWFFENFLLRDFDPAFQVFDASYHHLFNSYYKTQGAHWLQGERGCLSRPTVKNIYAYRHFIDEAVKDVLPSLNERQLQILETGLHHEQQHQELLLMDIKFILAANPSLPVYCDKAPEAAPEIALEFIELEGGVEEFGLNTDEGFSFCNETPRHKHFLRTFQLANRPVSNAEYLAFIEGDGYKNPWHWKSDGWNWVNTHRICAPLYWHQQDGIWREYSLHGFKDLDPHAPLSHISWYEADAFASWAGARLPSEFELEIAYRRVAKKNESGFYDPNHLEAHLFSDGAGDFYALNGNLWEWSASPYISYPGYVRPPGAFGEYNQKFMANQMVLRGGSFATSRDHFRQTYRNFFYPHQRWAFTGLRLARDASC